MPKISQVFTAIFYQFFCFCIAEAHLDVIFPQNGIFNDVTLTLAIRSQK